LERQEFEKLVSVEDEMWWFQGLHANLITLFQQHAPDRIQRSIVDVGCGTGGLLRKLAHSFPDAQIIGLDVDEAACRAARDKSRRLVCVASASAVPFRENSFDVIFSADVLCHARVDELESVRNFHRCLTGNGVLLLNLPAYSWLMSAHDRAVSNVQRYTATRLNSLLRQAGFAKIRTTYWNTILFPLMILQRMVVAPRGKSDVMLFPKPIDMLFRTILRVENFFIRRGVRFPCGGSILAIAMKS
jgi:SAM-dependent methyltransferase